MLIRRSKPLLRKAIIASALGAALCSGFPAFAADPPGADVLLHLTGDTFSRPVAAAADARGNFVMAEANPSADSPTI